MEKLRILLVLQTPWGTNLGMSKVHYDLKREYEKLGHEVEYLDWNRLYPKGQKAYNKIFGSLYSKRIFTYLLHNAHKFNVIDANFNCIPYPKSAYNFKGLVVYRSHGLQPLYRQIEESAVYKKMESFESNEVSFKTRLGNLYRFLQKKDGDYELFNSIKHADIVHALNKTEYDYFIEYGIPEEKVFLIPNGVPDEQVNELDNMPFSQERKEISFIGSWTIRKGIKDLNSIIVEVLKHTTVKQVNLLGGGEMALTSSFFDATTQPLLRQIPRFSQFQLSELLHSSKVGIFPSYVEGFGLAILEQLALGIPVVAYDIPGPRDILQPLDEGLLIKAGDKVAFGRKVAEILKLPEESYRDLSVKCNKRAAEFKMSSIAKRFIGLYQGFLKELN